jgi:hypothetical protein
MKEEIADADDYADWIRWVADGSIASRTHPKQRMQQEDLYCYKFNRWKSLPLAAMTGSESLMIAGVMQGGRTSAKSSELIKASTS